MFLLKRYEFWSAIGLLFCSNVFMTFAWYGHLKFKSHPIWTVIFVSWGIALFEYCLQVPANRIGSEVATTSQLKIVQEALTFIVFIGFSALYLKQLPTFNDVIAFGLITLAVGISLFQPF